MKKLVYSISIIKDEADIIESFIRYNESVIDVFFILDNGSTDNTLRILNCLIEEGKNIVIFNDHDTEYNQMQKTNELLRRVLAEYPHPDFIIPLDADEILVSETNVKIKDIIDSLDKGMVYYAYWASFIPTKKQHITEPFRPFEMEYIRIAEKEQKKIIFSPDIIDESFLIKNGSHDFFSDIKIPTSIISTVKFAHFPIRSINQYICKIVLGYTNRLVSTAYTKGISNHIENAYYELKMGVLPDLNRLNQEALCYCLYDYNQHISKKKKKFCVEKIDLKYTELSKIFVHKRIMEKLELLGTECREFRLQTKAEQGDDISVGVTKNINNISFRKVREERLKTLKLQSCLDVYSLYIEILENNININSHISHLHFKQIVFYGDKNIINILKRRISASNALFVEYENLSEVEHLLKDDFLLIIIDESRMQEHQTKFSQYYSEAVSLKKLLTDILIEGNI